MGLFVSRLLSSDLVELEAILSAFSTAIGSGDLDGLISNEGFWKLIDSVATNPHSLSELRGYVSSLLEEDAYTSALLLGMLHPNLTVIQRRFIIAILKLESISHILRSDIFWALIMDRAYVTALWKLASGRQCTAAEESRLGIVRKNIQFRKPHNARKPTSGSSEANQRNAAEALAHTQAAAPSAADPASATSAAAPAPAASPPASRPFVAPPLAARFFTILTLPSIRALLEDISRPPDAPPIAPLPPLATPPPVTPKAESATATVPLPHTVSAAIVAAVAPSRPDYKSNLILLLYRDLLKLEHIFEREKAALLPQLGMDPLYTALGIERSSYIMIRALIKFLLCGSGQKSHGHEHPGAANEAHPAAASPTHLPPVSAAAAHHSPGRSPTHSAARHHRHAPTSTADVSSLSLVARLLLDPEFQSTFLTHEFLSETFQTKLQYFIDAWPEDIYKPPASAATAASQLSGGKPLHVPDEGLDAQLSASLRSYIDFFLQLFSDAHVIAFTRFLQSYDQLFLEHLFATLYCDLLLPLMRPEQYIRNMLTAPTATNGHEGAQHANGNGSSGKKKSSGRTKPLRFNPNSANNLLLFPQMLPPDPSIPTLPPPAPIYVPLALLLSVGFMYHLLFEPVPISIIQQSKAQVDALRAKKQPQQRSATPTAVLPTKLPALERLRDLLLRVEVYAQWAQAAANPPALPPGAATDPHVPRFSRSIHAVVTSAPSLCLLEFLQLHTPHIASCLSKTLDEISMITTPPPPIAAVGAPVAAAMQFARANQSQPQLQHLPQQPKAAQSSSSSAPRDMFSPELSFHGNQPAPAPSRVNAAPLNIASTGPPLLGPVSSASAVPVIAPDPTAAIPVVQSQGLRKAPAVPQPQGWLASMKSWILGTSVPAAEQQAAAAIAASEPPLIPFLPAASLTLPPLLAPRRSRFDFYMQTQLRLWCNRVLEGRGFTQLFAAQQKAGGGPLGPQQVPSTIFVMQAHMHAHGRLATAVPGSSSNGGGIFGPIVSAIPPSSSTAEAFYIELLAFDAEFVTQLLSLLYTYVWVDARDEHRIRIKKISKMQQQQLQLVQGGSTGSFLPPSTPLRDDSSLIPLTTSTGPIVIRPKCSALFPSVSRNMSRAASTPIDLGPIRPQEYLALVCREVSALWSDDAIAVFLGRSDNFWRMVLDTAWWEIISGGEQQQQPPVQEEAHPLLLHPRVPAVSVKHRSTLYRVLSLVSNKSSPYYSVLLELGHHSQFDHIFSESNVSHVLSLLRLVCSWQVHEILNRFEKQAALEHQQQITSASNSGNSQDLYASLTAPFTFWGIVHSLSVVTQLRQQYLGALHWFLSKRNMEMQVEIWGVVKEVLYGEVNTSSNGAEDIATAANEEQKGEATSQVPAPAPLHLLSSAAAVASSPLLQQKLRLRRLRSLSQIAKSVHNSGILQAVFTFPLATAHFYSVWTAEMLWPTRSLSVDAYFPPAAGVSEPVTTESVTSLLLSQLGALLYTSARAASTQGYLHIPVIRSAFLEGIALALEEMHAWGSGAAQAAALQAKLERAQARKIRQETKEAIRVAQEARLRELAAAKQAEEDAKLLKGRNKGKKSSKPVIIASKTSPAPLLPPPLSVAPATPTPTRQEDRSAFNPAFSYRLPVNSSVPATADIPSLTAKGLSLSATVPISAATVTTAEAQRAVARAASEVAKLVPPTAAASSPPAPALNLLPAVIPPRGEREEEEPASAAPAAPSPGAPSSPVSPAPADEPVSLPPPFSFESQPVSVVDEDDEERSGARIAKPSASNDLSTAAAANAAAVAAALSNPRGSLHADSTLDLPEHHSKRGSTAAAAAALPAIPSLPQKHRLLYSFFQLLLAQPVLKLMLTAPSLWEMLSDIGFLELLTVLMFGAIEEGTGTTATKRAGGAAATGSEGSSAAPPKSAGGAFQAARASIAHTRDLLAAKRASLHAWQRLVAHWRFAVFMQEMRSKNFEVSLASAMQKILDFLNSQKGKALILAVMDGLEQREVATAAGLSAAAAAAGAPKGPPLRFSLAFRFHSLTNLLSHRSTVSLLTSPRFWGLFADGTTLRYFSQGKYLKLWWHNHAKMQGIHPGSAPMNVIGATTPVVWRLVKEGGAKAATTVRAQAAIKLEQQAQKLAGANQQAQSAAADRPGSKREQLKGFVRQKLSATATKLAQTAQPAAQPTRVQQPASLDPSVPTDNAADGSASSAAPPAGLASLQHFFSLISTLHALLSGSANRSTEPIRAAL